MLILLIECQRERIENLLAKTEPQTDTDCKTCIYYDTRNDWQGDCDDCENGSNYEPQTDCPWK